MLTVLTLTTSFKLTEGVSIGTGINQTHKTINSKHVFLTGQKKDGIMMNVNILLLKTLFLNVITMAMMQNH